MRRQLMPSCNLQRLIGDGVGEDVFFDPVEFGHVIFHCTDPFHRYFFRPIDSRSFDFIRGIHGKVTGSLDRMIASPAGIFIPGDLLRTGTAMTQLMLGNAAGRPEMDNIGIKCGPIRSLK